jgi:hypothetical protein
VNHEWETPGWRLEALKELVIVLKQDLIESGFTDAYAFFGSDIPDGYIRRLMNWGARRMMLSCLHFLKDEV